MLQQQTLQFFNVNTAAGFWKMKSSKSASHHEDSVDKFLYDDDDDDDDDIFSNNDLSESEANSGDNNQ